jgi:hypothetical protein
VRAEVAESYCPEAQPCLLLRWSLGRGAAIGPTLRLHPPARSLCAAGQRLLRGRPVSSRRCRVRLPKTTQGYPMTAAALLSTTPSSESHTGRPRRWSRERGHEQARLSGRFATRSTLTRSRTSAARSSSKSAPGAGADERGPPLT